MEQKLPVIAEGLKHLIYLGLGESYWELEPRELTAKQSTVEAGSFQCPNLKFESEELCNQYIKKLWQL